MPTTRRRFLIGTAALAAAAAVPRLAAAAAATPRQPTGPFYPEELPLDDDNDLVHIGDGQTAQGRLTDLSGRLLDRNGRPLPDVRIEIWQCDSNGRYRHPLDPSRREADPAFQGFGHTLTDDQGRYRFLTIRPVPYPGRTPHIHVLVQSFGDRPFVTQLYVAGEPRNAGDMLYQRIPPERRGLVTTAFTETGHDRPLQARWDIVLDES